MPLLRLQAKPLTYSTIAIVVACCPAPAYCHYHLNASITVVQCDLYSLVLLCFLAGLSFFYPDAAPEVVEKPGGSSLSKLKALYTHAKDLSESEVNFSTLLIGQLDTLLPSGPSGQQRRRIEGNDQKRRKMKTDSDISRISPNVRSQLEAWASLKGEQVAARVTPDESEDDEWFVVKVIHFDKETKEFEVLDEVQGDDDEGDGQRKYKLPVSKIIPFPKRNDPSTAQDFPPGRQVLAVYPGTTALYKATVVNNDRKRKMDEYSLEFDDDEEDGSLPQRSVPFHKVVPLPEGHRQ